VWWFFHTWLFFLSSFFHFFLFSAQSPLAPATDDADDRKARTRVGRRADKKNDCARFSRPGTTGSPCRQVLRKEEKFKFDQENGRENNNNEKNICNIFS
jgi:hypothetical protein